MFLQIDLPILEHRPQQLVFGFNQDLDLPPLTHEELRTLRPDLSLALSGYLADRNDQEGALAILEETTFRDAERKMISGILTASHLAAKDHTVL